MDLQEALHVVRTSWRTVLVLALIGVLIGLAYSLNSPRVYSATAQNFVAIGGVASGASVYSGSTFALQRVKSYVGVVDTEEVLVPVIEELGLQTTPQELARTVSASNPPQTVLLNVTAVGRDPKLTALIANTASVHFAKAVEAVEAPEGANSPIKVSQVLQAFTPTQPVSPRTGVNLMLGLVIGLGLGLGLALLRHRFATSITSAEALASATGSPVLGQPLADERPSTAMAALDRTSPRGDAYGTLRTNLQYVNVDQPPRVVAVTSAGPGEGKTTVACNLAIAVALTGAAVCLVEADLRKPSASQRLGIDSVMGLTDVLVGTVPVDLALVPWRRGLLGVLPAGVAAPNPSELLGSRQMAGMMAELRQRYDLVILDTAPVLSVSDAAVVTTHADGALLVARYGTTPIEQAQRAARALQQVDTPVLGTVLNAVPGDQQAGYYGYGYGDPGRPVAVDPSTASLRDMLH